MLKSWCYISALETALLTFPLHGMTLAAARCTGPAGDPSSLLARDRAAGIRLSLQRGVVGGLQEQGVLRAGGNLTLCHVQPGEG